MLNEAHVNGPEAPISRGILEEVHLIGRSKKDASTGELAGVVGVCRAVSVGAEREELFDSGDVGTAERIQLRDFNQPDPLQQLRGLLPFEGSDGVIEPSVCHLVQKGALPESLRAAKDHHLVVLAPRIHGPGYRGCECLPTDRACVSRVVCPQIVREHRIKPVLAVPFQTVDVFLNLVERVFCRVKVQRGVDGSPTVKAVGLLQIPVDTV